MAPTIGVAAFEEVEEDVGAQLVDGAVLVKGLESLGQPVDRAANGHRPVGREIEPGEVGGSVGVGLEDHPAFLDRSLVALLGVVGIGGDAQFGDLYPELTGGQPWSVVDDLAGHFSSGGDRKVAGPRHDHFGFGNIDVAFCESLPDPRETLGQVEGEVQFGVGRPSGQRQTGPDLGTGCPVGQLVVVFQLMHDIGDRGHRLIGAGGVVRRHLPVSLQHHHPVVSRQLRNVDPGQDRRQPRARRGCLQCFFQRIEHMFVV